jgi:hypothetical protein
MTPRYDEYETSGTYIVTNGLGLATQIFGFIFFLAGLFVMTSSIWGDPQTEEGESSSWCELAFFSLFFILPGAGLMLWRRGAILNRWNRKVTTWWGFIVPFRTEIHNLDEYKYITITRIWIQPSSNGGGGD